LEFIGQIHLSSSKGHRFMLVATDYFTKWTEVVPLRNMTQREVIEFITKHIIHRFGIPQILMTDQGTSFISHQVKDFVESYKISCSIDLHIMLKPMIKVNQVIKL
jgi:hypothetical protein